jgi:hypothetical protein
MPLASKLLPPLRSEVSSVESAEQRPLHDSRFFYSGVLCLGEVALMSWHQGACSRHGLSDSHWRHSSPEQPLSVASASASCEVRCGAGRLHGCTGELTGTMVFFFGRVRRQKRGAGTPPRSRRGCRTRTCAHRANRTRARRPGPGRFFLPESQGQTCPCAVWIGPGAFDKFGSEIFLGGFGSCSEESLGHPARKATRTHT